MKKIGRVCLRGGWADYEEIDRAINGLVDAVYELQEEVRILRGFDDKRTRQNSKPPNEKRYTVAELREKHGQWNFSGRTKWAGRIAIQYPPEDRFFDWLEEQEGK